MSIFLAIKLHTILHHASILKKKFSLKKRAVKVLLAFSNSQRKKKTAEPVQEGINYMG